MKSIFFYGLLIVFLFSSCNEETIYFQYHSIEQNEWEKDKVQQFDVEITDSTARYNIYIHMRNTPEYPYQNCWLFLEENITAQEERKDTIEFFLTDQRGRWLGKGIGAIKEMPILYEEGKKFERTGSYQLQIRHGMRDEKLKGVNNIGLRIEKYYGKK